jgi:predicted RNA-binding Zn-ribbon protein involved in translation (DUF1610 family)
MAEQKTGQAKKATGELAADKQGKEVAASAGSQEVEGRTASVYVSCPYCGSNRHVMLDFEGQWFTCGNCGNNYQVWV